MGRIRREQEDAYRIAADTFGQAIARLAASYESNPDRRADLVQDIHLALWKSFATYAHQCSLRTWVYRIAHNAAADYVMRERRANISRWVGLDTIEEVADGFDIETAVGVGQARQRVLALIQHLALPDRQILHLYLEGLDAAAISEITGFSAGNIHTKVYRFKALLSEQFKAGGHS